jgi:hypothetical protein
MCCKAAAALVFIDDVDAGPPGDMGQAVVPEGVAEETRTVASLGILPLHALPVHGQCAAGYTRAQGRTLPDLCFFLPVSAPNHNVSDMQP